MKKHNLLLLTLLLFICSSCGMAVKKLAGYKDLKVENKESVNKFIAKNELGIDNNYFLSVNSVSDEEEITGNFLFSISSSMLIYDNEGKRYCYNGTEECSGVQMKQMASDFRNQYTVCEKEEIEDYFNFSDLDTFLERLIDDSGNKITRDDLPKAEYYIFELWNKYSKKKKHIKEDFEWAKELVTESDIDFAIIYVNTDLLEEWGLEKGGKVKTKFKYKKGRSVSISFGEIPWSKE